VVELDPNHLLTRSAAEFVVTEFGDHAATRPLQHVARLFMSIARSVTPISQDGTAEILLRASDKSFAKTNVAELKLDAEPARGAADIEGPVGLGVASQLKAADAKPDKNEKARGGRVVVLGDSDFLQGPLLEAPELSNLQFTSGIVGWLAERPALIEIPPKKVKSGNIVFSQEDLWALLFRVVVLLPAAALTLGLAVWLNRRN
jgi:hypothetical protein